MAKNGAVFQPSTYRAAELVALEFATDDEHRQALLLYVDAHPDVYFAVPGRNNIIIPRSYLQWFEQELAAHDIGFTENRVGSISDLTPEQAAAVRKQSRELPPDEPRTAKEVKAEIARLRDKLSL